VDYEITPEPTEDERAAIVAALRALDGARSPGYAGPWRWAGYRPADEVDDQATARPRSNRGATRA
jgi:hypothetical protein